MVASIASDVPHQRSPSSRSLGRPSAQDHGRLGAAVSNLGAGNPGHSSRACFGGGRIAVGASRGTWRSIGSSEPATCQMRKGGMAARSGASQSGAIRSGPESSRLRSQTYSHIQQIGKARIYSPSWQVTSLWRLARRRRKATRGPLGPLALATPGWCSPFPLCIRYTCS
jgi:hypothetical protein